MSVLPAAPWREDAALAAVVAALGEVRYVGGAVRDTLAGTPVTDVDLATPLVPAEVIARLKAAGLKAVPTGIAHGTVTAVADRRPFEVTTLRRDVATDGRRATVAFSTDWQEDAARRDFTINALYADPATGQISDWFGGVEDLAARRIRFIGDPSLRIAEDHLRILRYYRFVARFPGGALDDGARAACRDGANSLKGLSRERVAGELCRLLGLPAPADAVALMAQDGIFAAFLPEVAADAPQRLRALATREGALAPDPLRRLLAILPSDPAIVDAVSARLRFSNADRARLAATLAASGVAEVRAAAYRHGPAVARDAALLFADDWQARCARLDGFVPPRLPLSGRDLIARGLVPGPAVARTLATVEALWIAEGFPDAGRLAAIADDQVAASMKS